MQEKIRKLKTNDIWELRITKGSELTIQNERRYCEISQKFELKVNNFFKNEYFFERILSESRESELILINLPHLVEGESDSDYMKYCEILTNGLKRIIFISNPGKDVITEF